MKVQTTFNQFESHLLDGNRRIFSEIIAPPTGTPNSRMKIYRDGYVIRLSQVLQKNYPILNKLMGKKFKACAASYIKTYPSAFDNIGDYGKQVAEHLLTYSATTKTPGLSELARFEWALSAVIEARDVPLLTPEELKKIPQESWPSSQLTIHPSMQILWQYWNVTDVWAKAREKEKYRPRWKVNKTPIPCVVWRYDNEAYFQVVEPVVGQALESFQHGFNFTEICEKLMQHVDENIVAAKVAESVNFLIGRQLISQVQVLQTLSS